MHFLALETNREKEKQSLINPDEKEIFTIPYHGFLFVIAVLKCAAIFIVILLILIAGLNYDIFSAFTAFVVFILCAVGLGVYLLLGYMDWRYDFILVTTEKVILVDYSLFKRSVEPLPIESCERASAQSQWWDIFSFGKLFIQVRRPQEQMIEIQYVPKSQEAAARITDAITAYRLRWNPQQMQQKKEGEKIADSAPQVPG